MTMPKRNGEPTKSEVKLSQEKAIALKKVRALAHSWALSVGYEKTRARYNLLQDIVDATEPQSSDPQGQDTINAKLDHETRLATIEGLLDAGDDWVRSQNAN